MLQLVVSSYQSDLQGDSDSTRYSSTVLPTCGRTSNGGSQRYQGNVAHRIRRRFFQGGDLPRSTPKLTSMAPLSSSLASRCRQWVISRTAVPSNILQTSVQGLFSARDFVNLSKATNAAIFSGHNAAVAAISQLQVEPLNVTVPFIS